MYCTGEKKVGRVWNLVFTDATSNEIQLVYIKKKNFKLANFPRAEPKQLKIEMLYYTEKLPFSLLKKKKRKTNTFSYSDTWIPIIFEYFRRKIRWPKQEWNDLYLWLRFLCSSRPVARCTWTSPLHRKDLVWRSPGAKTLVDCVSRCSSAWTSSRGKPTLGVYIRIRVTRWCRRVRS